MSDAALESTTVAQPRWRPLPARDRRVLGALVEKAKTTPDAYPLSINALRTACNQKNNRYPLMELEQEDVEESLARLRALGAVTEVQAGGRVERFRHHMYDWLGVDKVELAVMAELLLRGAQTEGELRGRAARMEPIADLNALRPVLASLREKKLIVSLSPEGRGHVISHALYEPQELEKLRVQFAESGGREFADDSEEPRAQRGASSTQQAVDELRQEIAELREELTTLRDQIAELRNARA
jgi:uncharacterized protein YceH (UPF0502 family)